MYSTCTQWVFFFLSRQNRKKRIEGRGGDADLNGESHSYTTNEKTKAKCEKKTSTT